MMATLRNIHKIREKGFNPENHPTKTSREQIAVEKQVKEVYENFHLRRNLDKKLPLLNRKNHLEYIEKSLSYLSSGYSCLDASRTWLCYWSLHSLSILGCLQTFPTSQLDKIAEFLATCQNPDGGFGGGPGQYSHLATTYAAVNALCTIGNEKAYKVINRQSLRKFLFTLRSPDGAFSMHRNGEVDTRGVYCALAVASLTDIACDSLFRDTAEWIVSCQTYEGGFSGAPGVEAHGGYTFCGLAALCLLDKAHLCDSQSLLRWLVNRQMKLEGGFQGRTNKLVDGCYSFWQAGACALLHGLLAREDAPISDFLFNQTALQEYVLICCQHKNGGLIDKPGKSSDLYHTCYTLSGLSVAQTNFNGTSTILGPPSNQVLKTHFVYNVDPLKVLQAKEYFKNVDL